MLPGAGPERAVPFSISQRDKERLDFARRFFLVELSHRLEPAEHRQEPWGSNRAPIKTPFEASSQSLAAFDSKPRAPAGPSGSLIPKLIKRK